MNDNIKIEQTNGPVISFEGHLIASVTSKRDTSERWTELHMYKAKSGRVVAMSVGGTVFPHEKTLVKAKVYEKVEDIVDLFGYTNLAHELYKRLKFTPTVQA